MIGITEILILVSILGGFFVLPKIMSKRRATQKMTIPISVNGKSRLYIVLSVFWPIIISAVMKPWQDNLLPTLYLGLGPVALGWSIAWIISGFKNDG